MLSNTDPHEHLLHALIAFLCERTGLSAPVVRATLAANDEFWEHHRAHMDALLDSDE